MKCVVDTNILVAAVVRDSTVRALLAVEGVRFFAPYFVVGELAAHREELLGKSGLDEESLAGLLRFIFEKVDLVPLETMGPWFALARSIMATRDVKDTPVPACALAVDADCIWSEDKHFMRQVTMRVMRMKDMVVLLGG